MKRLVLALALLVLVLVTLGPGHAQPLKLVNAQLFDQNGSPLANHSILIEGSKQPTLYNAWGWVGEKKLKLLAITDQKGYVQFVDLPAGKYTMKLVVPGGEPTAFTKFQLAPGYKTENITATVPVK